jgi:hypothetical protein
MSVLLSLTVAVPLVCLAFLSLLGFVGIMALGHACDCHGQGGTSRQVGARSVDVKASARGRFRMRRSDLSTRNAQCPAANIISLRSVQKSTLARKALDGCCRLGRLCAWSGGSLPSSLVRWALPLLVTAHARRRRLGAIVPRRPLSISQDLLNTAQVLTQSRQNDFALFTAGHFRAKQLKDQWICRLANSPDRCVGSLRFKATQASAIDKCLWIVAYGITTELGNSVAGQAQND